MRNLYAIDGKKVTQKQWYEHLEKLYMKQMPYAELGRLFLKACDERFQAENKCWNLDSLNEIYELFCKKRAELQAGGVPNE